MADYDAQPGRKAPPEPELSRAQRDLDDVDLHAGLNGVAGIVAGAACLLAGVASILVLAAGFFLFERLRDTLAEEV